MFVGSVGVGVCVVVGVVGGGGGRIVCVVVGGGCGDGGGGCSLTEVHFLGFSWVFKE